MKLTRVSTSHSRLVAARPIHAEAADDWSMGTPRRVLQEAVDTWRTSYKPGCLLDRINRVPHFKANGTLHFVHVRSAAPDAQALLLLHGWPGSFLEFLEAVPLLSAFHLVIPSLPGFGFSDYLPLSPGAPVFSNIVGPLRSLMCDLGYTKYIAQGGDYGSFLAMSLCNADREACAGYHINFATHGMPLQRGLRGLLSVARAWLFPSWAFPDEVERKLAIAALYPLRNVWDTTAYLHLQATRPQTLALALSSSPVALSSWLLEKFHAWDGGLTLTAQLDGITFYWMTDRGASVRIYRDSFDGDHLGDFLNLIGGTQFDAPMGYTSCRDISRTPRKWLGYYHSDIVYYQRKESCGHFFAWAQPQEFADEVTRFVEALNRATLSRKSEL
jgi:pimeloyl-ACP methyl ester carboxylesterase